MKKLVVEVCACNSCIMMGAMEIMENIESLKKLKTQLRLNWQIEIVMNRRICSDLDSDASPVVLINGEILKNANPETIMEKIIKLTQNN